MNKGLKRVWRSWGGEFSRQLYFELAKMFGRRRTHIGFGVFVLLELLFAILYKREDSVVWVKEMISKQASSLGPLSMLFDLEYFYSALTMSHMILGVAVVLLGGLFLALVAGDIDFWQSSIPLARYSPSP